jgi:hypothetical protein
MIRRMSETSNSSIVRKAETKTEDGREYPAAAFAYVPDPDKPSTWKLRLWSTEPGEKETVSQIGAAVAALGPGGFRGNRVQIPADDLPGVKQRVLQAWMKVHPDKDRDDAPAVLKDAPVEAGYGWDDEEKDYSDTATGPDAMTHLLMAYRLMIDHPECAPLLAPVMEIVHQLEEMLTAEPAEPMVVIEDETEKDIREEDGQFCVYSQTGRRFGCYATAEQAAERLQQIEYFRSERVQSATTENLVAFHDRFHSLKDVRVEHVIVHNLVEDELESRGVAPPYVLGDVDAKLAMIGTGMGGLVPLAKQADYQYTLGPVYIPDTEDAHGEFVDAGTLQKALWEWVRKGDRRIFLQHSEKVAGEMVEALTWPFPIEADMEVPNQGVTKQVFPADTPFLGVIWENWAWDLVKAGELRGYSMGGRARRVEADLPEMATL